MSKKKSLKSETKEAITAILKCKSARKHAHIWERLLTGLWVEAIEVSKTYVGATTARGIAHLLANEYRASPTNNAKHRIKRAIHHVERLNAEFESGLNVTKELKSIIELLGLNSGLPKKQGSKRAIEIEQLLEKGSCETSPPAPNTHARSTTKNTEDHGLEEDPRPLVLVANASEPLARYSALSARAERIANEHPAPVLHEGYRGNESIGRAKPHERAEWIAWIDRVSRSWAGPLYAQDLANMSGAPARWCKAMLLEYRAHLATGLNEDQRRSLTLGLIAEVEGLAREALALASNTDDERAKGGALKLALDSIDRRSKLIGSANLTLEQPAKVETSSWENTANRLGFDESTLKQIADIASQSLSETPED